MYGINSDIQLNPQYNDSQKLTCNIVGENDLGRSKDGLLEFGQSTGSTVADESNQCGNTLETVLVEFRVTWVLANFAEDVDESGKDGFMRWCQALSSNNDDSHSTYKSARAVLCDCRLTLHEVVVLCDLFWRTTLFDITKQGHEDVFRNWTDIRLRESSISGLSLVGRDDSQSLSVDFDK
jgi:hypothetical protein